MPRSTKVVLVVLAALVAAALLIFGLRTRNDGVETTAPRKAAASSGTTPAGESATTATTGTGMPPRSSEQRAAHRAAMLEAIARAREARDHRAAASTGTPAKPGTAAPRSSDSSATTLDLADKTGDTSEWGKRALGTLNSMLGQCYDLGLAEDANLAGTVTLRFTLVGEPNVGGLLERAEIVDATTTITQKTIRDCMTQQLYALELDPPPAGVTVEREISLQVP